MAPLATPQEYRMGFAGDTMNTAWYLRKLLPKTDHVDYLTAVGRDAASEQLLTFLKDASLGTQHIARHPERTVGLYMIQLQDGERSFSYWRGQSAARTLAQDPAPLGAALEDSQIAYFSGITIAVLPPSGRSHLLDTLHRFRKQGGSVVFDPNLRPKLWDTPDQMTTAIMQAAGASDIVLPSHEDEATWFQDADPQATAKRYADRGASKVIVKNGAAPMCALNDGTLTHHTPVPVQTIVDTTAAGDSFNAGFLAAHIAGQDLNQSITAGATLAAHVIGARGALVDITP